MLAHNDRKRREIAHPLHTFVAQCKNPYDFHHFVAYWGDEKTSLFAKTIDEEGKLPVEKINANPYLSLEAKLALDELLYQYHYNQPELPLSSPVIMPERFERLSPHSQLFKNLENATTVANLVRSHLLDSRTHPERNSHSLERNLELSKEIGLLRKKSEKIINNIFLSVEDKHFYSDEECILLQINEQHRMNALASLCNLYLKHRKGNCQEFSYLAFYYWHLLQIPTPIAILNICRGDHVFVVIDKRTNDEQPENWGPDTIVLDLWLGKVYLARELFDNLKSYLNFSLRGTPYNLLVDFNPNFHAVKVISPIPSFREFNIHKSLNFAKYFKRWDQFALLTLKEQVLFEQIIYPKVEKALLDKIITENNITVLNYPFKTLIAIFSNKIGMKIVTRQLLTLKMMENLSSANLAALLTDTGLAILEKIIEAAETTRPRPLKKTLKSGDTRKSKPAPLPLLFSRQASVSPINNENILISNTNRF